MRYSIIVLLALLYFTSLSTLWAEEERDHLILFTLDEVEKEMSSRSIDADCQQRAAAISQALKKAERALGEKTFEQSTALAKAKIEPSRPSSSQNFFSDFYLYSPFQALISNLTSFSPLYFYDSNDFLWAEPELQRHTWKLGTEISRIKYKEPDVMEEEGKMYGVVGSYTYHGMFKKAMLKVEAKASLGQLDYENSGEMEDVDNYMFEFRGLGGYDFVILEKLTVTPYIGIGYRYLNDDMSGRTTTTGASGYEREISYIYTPIGIEAITPMENGWSIGVTAEYDCFWDGTVKSHLGSVTGYYDIENDQDRGYGVRGSIIFQKKNEKIDFVIAPFITYWQIKESEITTDPGGTSWTEPKNSSIEGGGKLAVKF